MATAIATTLVSTILLVAIAALVWALSGLLDLPRIVAGILAGLGAASHLWLTWRFIRGSYAMEAELPMSSDVPGCAEATHTHI